MPQTFVLPTADHGASTALETHVPNALQALVTLHSGSTEPSTTYAYMLWADTGNNLLKQRNAANDDWVALLPLAADGGLSTLRVPLGAVSATSTFNRLFVAPANCVVKRLVLVGDTATTSSSGNEWQFALTNVSDTLELFSGTVGTFTALAGVGGGAELAADVAYALTPDQNASLAQGKVLDVTLTKVGTATSIGDLQAFIEISIAG